MEEQLVSFTLNAEEFAIDIMTVQEIIRIPAITRVPNAPTEIEGVINLRGNIIPIIRLHRVFGMPESEESNLSRVIVLQVGKETVGVRVDTVAEVLRLDTEAVEPPPSVVSVDSRFVRGIGKIGNRLVLLLDLESLMDAEQ